MLFTIWCACLTRVGRPKSWVELNFNILSVKKILNRFLLLLWNCDRSLQISEEKKSSTLKYQLLEYYPFSAKILLAVDCEKGKKIDLQGYKTTSFLKAELEGEYRLGYRMMKQLQRYRLLLPKNLRHLFN